MKKTAAPQPPSKIVLFCNYEKAKTFQHKLTCRKMCIQSFITRNSKKIIECACTTKLFRNTEPSVTFFSRKKVAGRRKCISSEPFDCKTTCKHVTGEDLFVTYG